MSDQPLIILASGSVHRRKLMDRLGLTYRVAPADIDETPVPDESPRDYVERLALEKARAVAARERSALVIGSDQACIRDGLILGKPGNRETAHAQLMAASGKRVEFLTAVCLLDSASGSHTVRSVPYAVRFRRLDNATVARYLEKEPALDAAGSFYSEGLGISLFESMEGDDPTALVGLPLITVCAMLRNAGVTLP